jgi:hypothetical protein
MATARLAAIDEGKEESGESDREETELRAKSTDFNTLTTTEDKP